MADIFEEVEGQLRGDRYKALALKAAPWVVGALLLALVAALGIWGYQTYRARAAATASEQYAAGLDAFGRGQTDQAYTLFGEAAGSSSKVYAALALMQQGGIRQTQGRTNEAVALFDRAAETAPHAIVADAARLKSAYALLDTAPYKDLEARLTPLTQEGRPYRPLAREALAFSKLMAGDTAGARGDFVVVSLLTDASDDMRQRAEAAIGLIDSGAAKSLAQAVKAAPPAVAVPAPAAAPPAAAPQQPASGNP